MKHKIFEGKSIIIAVPNHFELPQRFKENLEYLGFRVFLLLGRRAAIPLKDKIIHGYKKFFFGDKSYKCIVSNSIGKLDLLKQLSNINKVEYALFIRPDLFDFEVVKRVKEISNKIVAYQWDGMERFPLIKKYIDLFDKFYVFDSNDVKISPKLEPTTNFYFDDIQVKKDIEPRTVFFVGTYAKDRIPLLEDIILKLEENSLIPKFYLFSDKKREVHKGIEIISAYFSFKESAIRAQKAEYMLDLHNPIHNGLSFRTFESIGYEKKLITNNNLVETQDFYRPYNIFVINKNYEGFKEFLTAPYEALEPTIREKYSFSNWITQLLK